jgi:hypothetical protein
VDLSNGRLSGLIYDLGNSAGGKTVKDYRASIEKLRRDAAEAALIRDLATDPVKRDMFDRLYRHLNLLADEVEAAMKSSAVK